MNLSEEQIKKVKVPAIDKELLAVLEKTRSQLAKRWGVPAYSVVNDRTLREMAIYRPKSEADMLKIYGIGQVKLQRYGKTFINAIKEYESK